MFTYAETAFAATEKGKRMKNKKRLIDANAVVEWLKDVDVFFKGTEEHKTIAINIGRIVDHIEAMPTVDAVEVVRCKDCKHWLKDFAGSTEFVGRCEYANYAIGANGYCVYVERKDDE